MMLLNCFWSWSQNDSPKGNFQNADTLVTIPINAIRSANIKLIEREELLNIVSEQDTIIANYEQISKLKDNTINIYKNVYEENDKLINDLSKSLARKERMNYILIGTTSISIAGLITCLLIK